MKQNHSFLKFIIITVVILVVSRICFTYFVDFNHFISFISSIYADHGPLILVLAGFIEAIVLVGLYFPGSTIILLGATLAGAGVISLPAVIIWTTVGLVAGYTLNYWLGRLGGEPIFTKFGLKQSIEKARLNAQKSKLIYLWSTFHPNIAAVAAVALGAMKVNFTKFILAMTVSQFFWSSFWGVLFFYFGMVLLGKIAIVVAVVVIGMLMLELAKIIWPKKG